MRYPIPERPATVTRTMDPTLLNRVANDPHVRPWLGGDGPLDLTALLADPSNLAGVSESGGFLAVSMGRGRYEIHSLFAPDRAKGEAVRAMRGALDYIFSASDAVELVTKVPTANRAATGLARLAGFTEQFLMDVPWAAGMTEPVMFLQLSLDRWALRSQAAGCVGEWLHRTMEDAKRDAHSTLGAHSPDEEAHLQMAGAAVLMVQAGHAEKAALTYNAWAAFTGYPPMRLLRLHPPVFDLGEGLIVEAHPTEMEVLQCR